jgi:integral membrane protein (TIGR01906 family)
MRKKTIKLILIALLILIIPPLLLLSNFKLILFNENYYKEEFRKYNIYSQFPDADKTNSDVLDYFKNNDKLIKNNFFNDREKQHLLDVKNLINSVFSLFNYLLLIFFILLIILVMITKNKKNLIKYISAILTYGSILTLIKILFFFLLTKLNFTSFFTSFHKLFFPQGNWLFNPAIDKIILLYPENFFYDIAQKIILDTLFWAVILFLIGTLLLITLNNKIFKHNKNK